MGKIGRYIFALILLSLPALATESVVAVHVSELTQSLETQVATSPTPNGAGTTGYEWWTPWWHYFVMPESVKEALRSDGTPFVVVTDADILAGRLLMPDGTPRYPIVISLASEAVADEEIGPLRNYVAAGGYLFVGSSAFTRRPDGTSRGDFALATEMGLHTVSPGLENWLDDDSFTKQIDHRLVSHIPSGVLEWYMPLTSQDISWGISPDHARNLLHYIWRVSPGDATVLAEASNDPYLLTKRYGSGQFIYHAAMQPLIGNGGHSPGMYAYGIFRNAIEWAFEAANIPLVKVSPWPYPYNAAYLVRHDFESYWWTISNIEESAQEESSVGAKGDYYFCTGTLREEIEDPQNAIDGLRRAVSLYGATIGPHNGGLKNPNNPDLVLGDVDYWHWGPDEALDTSPPGYASGKDYAKASIVASFSDINGWLSGLTTNMHTWASPYFNSTREGSYEVLDELGVVTTGEQKLTPFPHWVVSTKTSGKRFSFISLPVSDWFVGSRVRHAIDDGHDASTIDALIDAYYDSGLLINLYSHELSTSELPNEYLHHCAAKSAIWPANAAGVFNWWTKRATQQVTSSHAIVGNRLVHTITVSGSSDPDAAIELVIPNWALASTDLRVRLDGATADPSRYRTYHQGIKVKVGTTASVVEVSYPLTSAAPSALSSASLNPTSVFGGDPSTGTVVLDNPAPVGGAVVSLSSSIPAAAQVPASVTVAVDEMTTTFAVTTSPVTTDKSVTISGTYNSTIKTATLTVKATSTTPTITLTSPTGGESWAVGTVHAITWTQTGLTGSVTIDLYKGGVYQKILGTASATAGTFSWTIASTETAGTDYRVLVWQTSVSDDSDANFTIVRKFKVDFNKDGQEDLLWRCYGTGYRQGDDVVWFMTQTGALSPMTLGSTRNMAGAMNLLTQSTLGKTYLTPMIGNGRTSGPGRSYVSPMDVWNAQTAGPRRSYVSPMDIGNPLTPEKKKLARRNSAQISGRDLKGNPVLKDAERLITGDIGTMALGYSDANLYTVLDTAWEIAGAGDFDGDGNTDILWRYYGVGQGQGTTIIWYMTGTTITSQGYPYQISDLDWRIDRTGDFNGDGKTDILWRYSGSGGGQGTTIIWCMDGANVISQIYPPQVWDTDWKIEGIGDFNGDGKADLLWRYYGTGPGAGTTIIWYMDGATIIGQDRPNLISDTDWRVDTTGDFNRDGKADIVWRYYGTGAGLGTTIIWYMDGATIIGQDRPYWVQDLNWRIVNR